MLAADILLCAQKKQRDAQQEEHEVFLRRLIRIPKLVGHFSVCERLLKLLVTLREGSLKATIEFRLRLRNRLADPAKQTGNLRVRQAKVIYVVQRCLREPESGSGLAEPEVHGRIDKRRAHVDARIPKVARDADAVSHRDAYPGDVVQNIRLCLVSSNRRCDCVHLLPASRTRIQRPPARRYSRVLSSTRCPADSVCASNNERRITNGGRDTLGQTPICGATLSSR